MAEWDIKNKEHNEMFDMRDTVQTWPNESHQISFSIVSTPGKVEHSIWLSVEGSRDFANYLLRACDRVERIQEARKARSINQSKGRWR